MTPLELGICFYLFLLCALQLLSKHHTLEPVLEPLDSVLLGDLVGVPNTSLPYLPSRDTCPGAGEAHEEVHAVNARGGVVLDSEVDVLVDAEAEVARVTEVPLKELVLLHLEATLEDLQSLLPADGHVDGDLLITTDAKGTESVPGLGVDGLLAGELLKHTRRTGETIARLANAAVEDELINLDFPHGVLLFVGHGCG